MRFRPSRGVSSKRLSSLGAVSAGNAAEIYSDAKSFARSRRGRSSGRLFVRSSCRRRVVSRAHAPAIYENVERPILIRPAIAGRVYEPPVHGVISQSVVVQPSALGVFYHPPVVGVARERVLVRAGGYAWSPSRRGLFDRW